MATKSKTASLVTQAAALSEKELSELLNKLNALKSTGKAISDDPVSNDIAGEMYRCLAEAANGTRQVKIRPAGVARKHTAWPKFVRAAEEAERYVESLAKDRVKKLAVRQWCCRLIINHMLESNVPLEMQGYIWGLENVSSVIDSYFPGYMVSGLMGVVIDTLVRGNINRPKLHFKR